MSDILVTFELYTFWSSTVRPNTSKLCYFTFLQFK